MKFIKMHGLGNDFVLIHKAELLNRDMIKTLSDRHRGIGFDQAIIIDDFNLSDDSFKITFLNADGSHAGGCGNGTRAVAGYFYRETGKTDFDIHIAVPNGGYDSVHAKIISHGIVKITMPKPKFLAEQIPLSDLTLNPQHLETPYFNKSGFCVNVGNPHYVIVIENEDDFFDFPLNDIGYNIETDSLFPERINFEIIFIENKNTIKMRVWERGAGITQACGTGACASVIAAVTQGLTDNTVTVIMDGGALHIDYNPETNDLSMQGDYNFVFEGQCYVS
jgi:diaminopimelate epimerase